MDFYRDLGYLIFGSRLRRLSEYFLSEINRVYAREGIDFDATWFPVFYLLSKHQPVSILELAETMQVSHSGASQLIATLKKRHLVKSAPDKSDRRKQAVQLTAAGEALLKQLLPIWEAMSYTLNNLLDNPLLAALTDAEQALQSEPLSEKILAQLHHE